MQWISFAQSDSLTRSILHVLPSTRGGIVTQAISCSIELFGDRPESTEVAIDGIRLNQPDGIRLDEAFLRLKEGGNSLIGICVKIESAQQRSDLRHSSCLIELFSRERTMRFPMPVRDAPIKPTQTLPVIADRLCQTSVVFVNRGLQYNEVQIRLAPAISHAGATPLNISVSPQSVSEYSLASLLPQSAEPFHASWGEVSMAAAEIVTEIDTDVAAFVLYREVGTQRIVSVLNV